MDDENFRYWSDRSLRETQAAINAACDPAAAAHRELARLCMRRAMTMLHVTMVAHDVEVGQICLP